MYTIIIEPSIKKEWKLLGGTRSKHLFLSTCDAEETALSNSVNNTIGWEDSKDIFNKREVVDFIGDTHTSCGVILNDPSDSSVRTCLLLSKNLGLIQIDCVATQDVSMDDYIEKGIPKEYKMLDIYAFVIDPTIEEIKNLLGSRAKITIGEYCYQLESYIK